MPKNFEIKHLITGPLLTNCYILISKGESLVIDPGGGLKQILEELTKNQAKLKYIVLTHYHWDHTLGAPKLRKDSNPPTALPPLRRAPTGAKIFIHEGEKDFLKFKVDQFLKDGDEIKVGEISLKIVHTSGHTKGSICLLGDGFIFTGDTLFEDAYGRTDLSGGSQTEMENSLEKLKKILKPGMKVYPGHGEVFEK